jgi:hypothetical protein
VDTARHLAGQPGDQHHAAHDHRQRDEEVALRPLLEQRPGGDRDEQHLHVPDHGRDARTEVRDGVVPQHEVQGQERPGQHRAEPGPDRPRAEPALLQRQQRDQHRHREQAPPERGRGRAGSRQLDQDGRGRNAHRAQCHRQQRPALCQPPDRRADLDNHAVAGNYRIAVWC